ncbi:MAG: iron-containing alcohol dehydrogenase [Succinivibrio sp.]|nr:iron-containing alcohol dehydrogenase [Succinivibrio sp.]
MWQPQGIFTRFVLRSPVILSGEEAIRGLFNYPACRVAVIHGTHFNDQALFTAVFAKKFCTFIARSWNEEPDLPSLQPVIRELESLRPDLIIACGGGSVIDGAKLCRLLLEYPSFRPGAPLDAAQLRTAFIAVPTTFGSGAEVSSAAVFVNRELKRKEMVVAHELQPAAIVYDPRYLATSNAQLCLAALDCLAHLLEGYVSVIDHPLLERSAEAVLLRLCPELVSLCKSPEHQPDLPLLQYAGFIGGQLQNHCLVGAAHALSHQLTAYGYGHCEAVGLLLPAVIKANLSAPQPREKYTALCRLLALSDPQGLCDFIGQIQIRAGIASRQAELKSLLSHGLEDRQFCENVLADPGGQGNPIPLTADFLKLIVESL